MLGPTRPTGTAPADAEDDVTVPVPVAAGKVRDLYAVGDDELLLVASDRISTYDVVHPTPIPDKGRILTSVSAFWFDRLAPIAPHHLLAADDRALAGLDLAAAGLDAAHLAGRTARCRRAEVVPFECVVRGHLAGSGWADYRRTVVIHGHLHRHSLDVAGLVTVGLAAPVTADDWHRHAGWVGAVRAITLARHDGAGLTDLAFVR